jgi:hypothetical protein
MKNVRGKYRKKNVEKISSLDILNLSKYFPRVNIEF